VAYKKPPKSPSEPPKTRRAPSKAKSTMARSQSIAKKRTAPKVPKPYLALAPAKSSSKRSKPSLPKGTFRSTSISRPKGASGKAYKATRGTSSKRAVSRVASKVMNRQLRSKGIVSTRAARAKARQIVRKRKM
jgi:hypothetical protein